MILGIVQILTVSVVIGVGSIDGIAQQVLLGLQKLLIFLFLPFLHELLIFLAKVVKHLASGYRPGINLTKVIHGSEEAIYVLSPDQVVVLLTHSIHTHRVEVRDGHYPERAVVWQPSEPVGRQTVFDVCD